jgi:hypothetical protein
MADPMDCAPLSAASNHAVIDRLKGIPCWNVQQGHGSFLTFEFGSPTQSIGKVLEKREGDPRSYRRRLVTIRGDWHLWIYCCGWRIAQDGNVLANSESIRECIMSACVALNGQALVDFQVWPERGASCFKFDLGGKLVTGPYDDELLEQWALRDPDGNWFSYRSDGTFYKRAGTS